MKPAAFDYVRPQSLAEALTHLANDNVKVIAGGQTLAPLLALRMTAPKLLIDIGNLTELKGVQTGPDGTKLGALTRWRDILDHPQLALDQPLLVEAIGHVAHYQIRNRGTVGGGCSHADPAAEMPAIAVTCEAQFEIASLRGTRTVPADKFFVGMLTTALEPDELLISIHLPSWSPRRRYGFQEFSRRQGDFALAGCSLFWEDQENRCHDPHMCVFGVGDTARRLSKVENLLSNRELTSELIAQCADLAQKTVTTYDDLYATADYRAALVKVMVERALYRAAGLFIEKAT